MRHNSCYGYTVHCCTMHNNTHFVHNRPLKLWRVHLLLQWPCYYVPFPPLSGANCRPFPLSGGLGPPSLQDGSLFPRVHAHPLSTACYSYCYTHWENSFENDRLPFLTRLFNILCCMTLRKLFPSPLKQSGDICTTNFVSTLC
jgi:hypothetical protein